MFGKFIKAGVSAAMLLTASTGIAAFGSAVIATPAAADSCWNHNGSIMRLKASGNRRWFYYERPRSALRAAGVRPGTLLFAGRKSGNWYSGTARRFSRYCPGNPLVYRVEGPVASNQLRVQVEGSRDVYRQCRNTGRTAYDTLVFTYAYDC